MSPRLILILLLVLSAGCNLFRASEVGPAEDAGNADIGMTPEDSGDDGDTGIAALCGNGVLETGEACERGDSRACTGVGFDGGTSHCTPNCEWDESACYTCTHFIAPESGDDGNTGRSAEQARQSAAAIDEYLSSADGLGAGDVLCFHRGESMRLTDPILITRSGSAEAPLVVGAYGSPSAAPPHFTASIVLPPANMWTDEGNGVHSIAVDASDAPDGVSRVWVGDEELGDAASDQTLSDGVRFYDGTRLYIAAPSLTSEVAATVVSAMVAFGSAPVEHVEVAGLSFDRGEHGVELIAGESLRDLVVRDNTFSRLDDAVRIASNDVDVADLTITDNDFRVVGNAIYWTAMAGRSSRSSVIARNTLVQPTRSTSRMVHLQNPSEQHVFSNDARSEDSGRGGTALSLETIGAGSTLNANTVERNFVAGFARGIALTSQSAELAFEANDIAQNVLIEQAESGIFTAGCDMSGTSRIVHNTVVAAEMHSVRLPRDCGYTVLNNLSVIAPGTLHIDTEVPPAGFLIVPNSFDHNLYVPGDGNLWSAESGGLSFDDWQLSGFDTNGAISSVSPFGVGVISEPFDAVPSADSPALDAALGGEAEQDFAGRNRPVGAGADIGAWEVQSAPP